jgi:hypothetical protein
VDPRTGPDAVAVRNILPQVVMLSSLKCMKSDTRTHTCLLQLPTVGTLKEISYRIQMSQYRSLKTVKAGYRLPEIPLCKGKGKGTGSLCFF